MSQTATAVELPSEPSTTGAHDAVVPPARLRGFLLGTICIEAAAFLLLLWLLLARREQAGGDRLFLILLSMAAVLVTFWGARRRERTWAEPVRHLADLLPRIRSGDAPIDELSNVEGALAPLARELALLCHDLGRQRAEVATMEANLRQHVANRTNALERKIGSLRQQATRDVLTGLYNRRSLDELLPQAIERCRASGTDLCLLMIDVDHFKKLNDTRGHPAGDELLRNIGQIIRSTIRDGDAAFRYGGDEFVVVMEGQEVTSGRALCDRLTSLVNGLVQTFKVTPAPALSIGLATLGGRSTSDPAELIRAADDSLYDVKRTRHAKLAAAGCDA